MDDNVDVDDGGYLYAYVDDGVYAGVYVDVDANVDDDGYVKSILPYKDCVLKD